MYWESTVLKERVYKSFSPLSILKLVFPTFGVSVEALVEILILAFSLAD